MKFSIIVPCYEVERYIEDCIQSLFAQTWHDFEVILIDDCSPDSTADLIETTIGDDRRFRLMRMNENKGQSVARNIGLEQAEGEYVLFLDADDSYSPNALTYLAQRLDEDDLDQLFFSAETVYENRHLRRNCYENQDARESVDGVLSGTDLFILLEATDSFRPSACLFAIRASIIKEHHLRFKEGILHEDLLFTLQTFPVVKRATFDNVPLYRRRVREGSTMTQGFTMRHVDGHFRAGQALRRWLEASSSDYGDEFVQAFTRRVYETFHIGSRYLQKIDGADIEAYRGGLTAQDRIEFDLHVYHPYLAMSAMRDEVYGSTTYRLGRVFMAVPTWLKDKIVLPH